MDSAVAASLAVELLAQHGLPDWAFRFNRRKRALGLCRHDLLCIELSTHFVRGNEEPAIRETLLHEIAHALAGQTAGHGPRWKRLCLQLGAKPERTCRTVTMPLGAWRGVCPTCGRTYSRHRRPLRRRMYLCRHCPAEVGQIGFHRMAAPDLLLVPA